MATGLAIMGFGGGAMIGTPLANLLMNRFATPQSVGVWQTFLVMGALYSTAMMMGAFGYRLPPQGWSPGGLPRAAQASRAACRSRSRGGRASSGFSAAVLCLNVSAGIGILGMAAPMIQEMFKDRVTASAAAGFAGLLSPFNIVGRIFWASLSDVWGRRLTAPCCSCSARCSMRKCQWSAPRARQRKARSQTQHDRAASQQLAVSYNYDRWVTQSQYGSILTWQTGSIGRRR